MQDLIIIDITETTQNISKLDSLRYAKEGLNDSFIVSKKI